jgi:hypothetical protein
MKMSKFMARENLVRTEILNRNHEGRRTPFRPPEHMCTAGGYKEMSSILADQ